METIDLHGLSLEKAKEKVVQDLENAYQYQEQVVRIIHGQGKHSAVFPVIKSFVRHWLLESEFGRQKVAAFFRGEDGSPYTVPNAGETIVVLKIAQTAETISTPSLISAEEDREARKNSKAIRAERLRTARRRGPRFR
jgi:Uncharacterized protein conserved in bacteria